jgi:hypothetical protein
MARLTHQPNDRFAQRRHHLREVATPSLGLIFVDGHIADPMGLVFDVPVTAHQPE